VVINALKSDILDSSTTPAGLAVINIYKVVMIPIAPYTALCVTIV
jgi:hypothetical protein